MLPVSAPAAPAAHRAFAARLGARLRAEPGPKIAVLGGLTLGICVPYALLQRVRVFPLRAAPATPLDGWIGFDPSWIGVYLSVALLVPLAPLLAERRGELLRYARGLALLCAVSFTCFLLAPVEGPRPEMAPDHPAYALLVRLDRPSNSMPSLHAGLAVYSILFALRTLRGSLTLSGRLATAGVAWTWGALIAASTLATKQHWALDLPAGALLAWAAHAWTRRAPQAGGEPDRPAVAWAAPATPPTRAAPARDGLPGTGS